MNRPFGILFHRLKGSKGWSDLSLSRIDIARVVTCNYDKRLFKLFNRDKPYTLEIKYYLPETSISVAPVFSGRGGVAVYNETTLIQTITKRYESEDQVKNEISTINKKLEALDDYNEKLREKLLNTLEIKSLKLKV